MTKSNLILKRLFDFVFSIIGIIILIIPILILIIISTIDLMKFGLFSQERVGQNGEIFHIYKIKTLNFKNHSGLILKKELTKISSFLRVSKLDELPQIFNVFFGQMSFVGPRPDIKGFADKLEGEDRIILKVKPGITGPATLKYKNEDQLLAVKDNPEDYNRNVIWKDKVEINKDYVKNWSFILDMKYLVMSIKN